MRVIAWSVELLPGTSRRRFLAHTHNFYRHIHTRQLQSQIHNIASHRRPHSPSSNSLTPWLASHDNIKRQGHDSSYGNRRHVHQSSPHGDTSTHTDVYRTKLKSLLAALRQCDTFNLYLCLLDFTRGASLDNQSFCQVVQDIPPTTFSEILRNFDPFHISTHVDSAPDVPISWGAAIHSPLGELINKWGIKVLYVRILNRLRLLQLARQLPQPNGSPSQIPLLRDYVVLLRCAGATSNIKVVKTIWWELDAHGYSGWRHAELFAEFIKARYLTEALYANHDLSRFRQRPLDLHRSIGKFPPDIIRKLKRLNASLTRQHSHRFGQNVNEHYFAEPLTRLLRKRKPLNRLQRQAITRRMIPGDELLICAILKANGRQGRVYASNVLMRLWGINITSFQTELGSRKISGGHDYPLGSALAPTEALLDAVVHCYGNMGEVLLAKDLVDFVSRRWDIVVPNKTWSALLEYARIYSTDPAQKEWRMTRFHKKLLTPQAVIDIWEFSTQAPHRFQPGMRDYFTIVKSMMGPQAPLDQILAAIRQLTPLYRRTTRLSQLAWAELILTTQQDVSNSAAYRRYRVLRAHRHYMWYSFHYIARQILKKLSPLRIASADAVRHIPDLVAELEPFLRPTIQYRIATGVVDLRLDLKQQRTVETQQTLEEAHPVALKRVNVRSREDMSVDLGWNTLKDIPNTAVSSAVLGDYMESLGFNQRSQRSIDTPLGRKKDTVEQVEEDEEEDDALEYMDADYEQEAQLDLGEPIGKHMADDHHEISDWEEVDGRTVIRPLRPTKYVQDAFHESRNPAYKPPVAEELTKAPRALSADQFADALAGSICSHSRHRDVDSSAAARYNKDWDKDIVPEAPVFANRQSKRQQQIVDRPAYALRPRYSAPPGEPSLSTIREDGEEFTGFHDDPLKVHFAAHRIIRVMVHVPGVPIRLGGPGLHLTKQQVMGPLLDLRM